MREHTFLETVCGYDIHRDRRDDDLMLSWGRDSPDFVYCRIGKQGNLDFDPERLGAPLPPLVLCRLYELFEEYKSSQGEVE